MMTVRANIVVKKNHETIVVIKKSAEIVLEKTNVAAINQIVRDVNIKTKRKKITQPRV
jgi:hypothetical protein